MLVKVVVDDDDSESVADDDDEIVADDDNKIVVDDDTTLGNVVVDECVMATTGPAETFLLVEMREDDDDEMMNFCTTSFDNELWAFMYDLPFPIT